MSLNTTSQTQQAITALDTLVKQNGALIEQNNVLIDNASTFAMNSDVAAGKAEIATAIESKGGTATASMSLAQLAGAVADLSIPTQIQLTTLNANYIFSNSVDYPIIDMSAISVWGASTIYFSSFPNTKKIINFPNTPALTSLEGLFSGCRALVEFNFGRMDFSNVRNISGLFYNCSEIESIDISYLPIQNELTAVINNLFSACTKLKNVDMRGLKFASGNNQNTFAGCAALEKINMIDTDVSLATGLSSFFNVTPPFLTTLVGDETYQNVVNNDIKILKGLNISLNINVLNGSLINQASLRALINGLADRTGQSALTLTMGANNIAKLSADDIAAATNKNWTLA